MAARFSFVCITALVQATTFTQLCSMDEAPVLWGDLKPGLFAVGFRWMTVYSTDGRKSGSEAVLLAVWYPATDLDSQPLSFEDYISPPSRTRSLAPSTPRAKKEASKELRKFYRDRLNFPNLGKISNQAWESLLATPVAAIQNAAPVEGRFSLLLGAGDAATNSTTCEFLASHGFIVAQVIPSTTVGSDSTAVERLIRQMVTGLAAARALPNVYANRVATYGFSGSGLASLALAMRQENIEACILLESSIFDPSAGQILQESSHHGPEPFRLPLLHVARKQNQEFFEPAHLTNALQHTTRYWLTLNTPQLLPQDLTTHGIATITVLGRREQSEKESRAAFTLVHYYLLEFLNYYLRDGSTAVDSLDPLLRILGLPLDSAHLEVDSPSLNPGN